MTLLAVVSSYKSSKPEAVRHRNILRYLKKKYTVHVLCLGERRDRYEEEAITVHEIPCSSPASFRSPSRLVRMFMGLFKVDPLQFEIGGLQKKVSELIESEKVDVVIGSATPFGSLMVGMCCQEKRVPFIYDTCDPCYGNVNFSRLRNRAAYLYEKTYLPAVSRLVVTNEETRDHYLKNFGDSLSADKVSVIEMGTNSSSLPGKKEPGTPVKIIYAGSFYKKIRNPVNVFQAVETFPEAIELEVFTHSKQFFDDSQQRVTNRGLVPHEQLNEIYEFADILLFLDNAYGLHTPGKLFEVLALNRPILFVGDGDTFARRFAEKFEHVFVCENKVESIQKELKYILTRYSDIVYDFSRMEPYYWKNRAKKFEEVISSVR